MLYYSDPTAITAVNGKCGSLRCALSSACLSELTREGGKDPKKTTGKNLWPCATMFPSRVEQILSTEERFGLIYLSFYYGYSLPTDQIHISQGYMDLFYFRH